MLIRFVVVHVVDEFFVCFCSMKMCAKKVTLACDVLRHNERRTVVDNFDEDMADLLALA